MPEESYKTRSDNLAETALKAKMFIFYIEGFW